MSVRTADVAVIGAGLLGLSAGYWLAKAGVKVIVLDKGRTAYEASSRATGYLSLRGDSYPEIPLAKEAERLWDTLDEELGYPTEWQRSGRLWAATNEEEWTQIKALYRDFAKTDLGFRLIEPRQVRDLVPQITDATLGGVYTPRSGHANPQRTSQAFAWAFQDRGGEICEFEPVTRVRTSGGKVTGVDTTKGSIDAPVVISCAGPQNGLIAEQVGIVFPVASARFEAMITAPLPPLYQTALIAHGLSIRQTKRGNLHINGGPHEWVSVKAAGEPAKPTTPLLRHLARRVVEVLPSVAGIQLLRCWAGIVDVTPDTMCAIERFTSPEGLVMASAASHGFGMAPSMGRVLADLALNGKTPIEIEGLSLSRFQGLPPDWRERIGWQPGAFNT
jgi:sarcosine oxidase subunit beta